MLLLLWNGRLNLQKVAAFDGPYCADLSYGRIAPALGCQGKTPARTDEKRDRTTPVSPAPSRVPLLCPLTRRATDKSSGKAVTTWPNASNNTFTLFV